MGSEASPHPTGLLLNQSMALEPDSDDISTTLFLSQVFRDTIAPYPSTGTLGSFGPRLNPVSAGADLPLRDLLRRLRFVVDLHALPLLTSDGRETVVARVVDRVVQHERLARRAHVRGLALRLLDGALDELRGRLLKDYKAFQQLLWRVQRHLPPPEPGDPPSGSAAPVAVSGAPLNRRRGRGG